MGQYWLFASPRTRETVMPPNGLKLGEFLFEGTPAFLARYLVRPDKYPKVASKVPDGKSGGDRP